MNRPRRATTAGRAGPELPFERGVAKSAPRHDGGKSWAGAALRAVGGEGKRLQRLARPSSDTRYRDDITRSALLLSCGLRGGSCQKRYYIFTTIYSTFGQLTSPCLATLRMHRPPGGPGLVVRLTRGPPAARLSPPATPRGRRGERARVPMGGRSVPRSVKRRSVALDGRPASREASV